MPTASLVAALIIGLLLFPVRCLDDPTPHSIFVSEQTGETIFSDEHRHSHHETTVEEVVGTSDGIPVVRSMPESLTVAASDATADATDAATVPLPVAPIVAASEGDALDGFMPDVTAPPPRSAAV